MKLFVVLYTVALMFINICSCQYENDFLPKNVKPLRYNLTIEPKLKETNYTKYFGSVSIEIEVLEDTNNITLHAKKLTIKESSITISNYKNNQKTILNTSFDEIKDFYIIQLNDDIKTGEQWKLYFGFFSGLLTDTKYGFYLAKYNDALNKETYLTVTELEPMHARQVFPCFDEPALKATFIVNLIRPNTSMSASNMPIQKSTDLGDGRFKDTFRETKLMSTYLVAFIISEFKYTEVNDGVRILVRSELINYTKYMLSEAPKLFRTIEEYTGLPYALDKIDLVAIPDAYFLDGAMENWGLIVYAEKYLLCSNTSLLPDLQKCTTFTAHELAHQWFGNLATPKKWNYMWLSEGFSSFFQYYIADKVEPSWRLMEQYVIEEQFKALENDIVPNTQPITFIFDSHDSFQSPYIYYSKASTVIHMTQHVLTEEIFQNGLKIYLKQNQFNSTEPKNLYNAFEEAVKEANASYLLDNQTITEFLEQWTTTVGHPIVVVTRNYETGTVTFRQKTYRLDNKTDSNIWYIPITYMTNREEFSNKTDFWLINKTATIELNASDDWLVVNKEQIGFYRVSYDKTNWKRLSNFLHTDKFTLIPPVNRAQLLADAVTFARYGFLNYDFAFNLTTYVMQETDYIPIKCFLRQLTILQIDLKDNERFKNYVRMLQVAYDALGVEEKSYDTHVDRLTRMEVLNWMCRYEDPVCQKTGLEMLRSKTFNQISPNLQFGLLCGGIQIATIEEWTTLLETYYLTKDIHQKNNYITALTCTKDEKKIIRLLDTLFNVELPITPNDRIASLVSICKYSNVGLNTTLNYFLRYKHEHYEKYSSAFGPTVELIPVPEESLYQLEAIKSLGRLKELPIKFYLNIVRKDNLSSKFLKWIEEYKMY